MFDHLFEITLLAESFDTIDLLFQSLKSFFFLIDLRGNLFNFSLNLLKFFGIFMFCLDDFFQTWEILDRSKAIEVTYVTFFQKIWKNMTF